MTRKQTSQPKPQGKVPTLDQVSSGGVAFRRTDTGLAIAIVLTKPKARWQLPKGIVDARETPESTAVREVREEVGIETHPLGLIETIEYWYRSRKNGSPVRFHKFVHFYLLEYRSGDTSDHDHEVEEARSVGLEDAVEKLAFESERAVVEKAREMLSAPG